MSKVRESEPAVKRGNMKWRKDGDLYVARGSIGTYEIHHWILRDGDQFQVFINYPGSKDGSKQIGMYSSLKTAKILAEHYDGYRAS